MIGRHGLFSASLFFCPKNVSETDMFSGQSLPEVPTRDAANVRI
jgi:hypothetical protein